MYLPLAQSAGSGPPGRTMVIINVRSAGGSPSLLARSVGAALTAVDRDLTFTLRPLADSLRASIAQERLVAMLSGFLGALALLLAGLGLYGVMSYAVSRRRTELGIRLALGAAPRAVMRLVLARVALLVGAGRRRRRGREPVAVTVRGAPALWSSTARSRLAGRGGADARRCRRARRLAADPPCVADRSRPSPERSLRRGRAASLPAVGRLLRSPVGRDSLRSCGVTGASRLREEAGPVTRRYWVPDPVGRKAI